MTIGEKITQRRLAAHLSQEILAERLGVSTQDVSRWESGEVLPDAEKLLQLCRVFGISADEMCIRDSASTAAARSCWKRVRCPHRQAFWSRGSSAPSASVPAEMRSPSFTWDPAICSAAAPWCITPRSWSCLLYTSRCV